MVYKWKDHFNEMKGDVYSYGCHFMKKKENKKMHTQSFVITPVPTSSCFFINALFVMSKL